MASSNQQFDSLQLQDRDFAFLRGLFESRIMASAHAATLYFGSKREYTKKRLQKLKAAGLVSARRRQVNEPAVLFLTRKGFTLLKTGGHLLEYPPLGTNSFEARANVSEFTIRHELEIMDVKAAFYAALAGSEQFSLTEFSTWPLLCQFETPRDGYGADVLVKPDGFIRIHEKEEGTSGFSHDCFLEVDRSSETQDTLVNRAACYLDYYRTGGFAVRNGASRSEFKDYPFRVLIILKSAERRNITAEKLIHNNPPILTQTWLTTLAEVMTDPLGAIWIRPADYRDVVRNTPFLNERSSTNNLYRRRVERESFVEFRVKKSSLLAHQSHIA
jgi:hypothetical protein